MLARLVLFLALVGLAPPALAQEPEEIRALVAELGSGDFARRDAAHKALEEMGEAARPYLEEAIEHEDLEIRTRVRRLLGRIEFGFLEGGRLAGWNPELTAQLRAADQTTRLEAARTLARRLAKVPAEARDEARRVLEACVARTKDDEAGEDRILFADALARLGDPAALLEVAVRAAEAGLDVRSLRAPGRRYRGDPSALVEAMGRAEGKARIAIGGWILMGLTRSEDPIELDEAQAKRVLELAGGVDPEADAVARLVKGGLAVRLGSLDGLPDLVAYTSTLRRRGAENWLRKALGDTLEHDRRVAVLARAGGLPEPGRDLIARLVADGAEEDDPDRLLAEAEHESPLVREVAVALLGTFQPDGFEAAIERRLEDASARVRIGAARALFDVGQEDRAIEVLTKALDSEDPVAVREGLRALTILGRPEATERAGDLLADPRPDVRAAAAFALGHVKGTPPGAEVAKLLGDPAECLYRPGRNAPLRAGTVDAAVRLYFQRKMQGEELPADAGEARAAIDRWLEARRERDDDPDEEDE